MKRLIAIIICGLILSCFGCTKTESDGEKNKTETGTTGMTTDSLTTDSTAVEDLQKSTEDLKKEADDVEKSVDDLLK
jgi:hypothetical protein